MGCLQTKWCTEQGSYNMYTLANENICIEQQEKQQKKNNVIKKKKKAHNDC